MKGKINGKIVVRTSTAIIMILIIIFLLRENNNLIPNIKKYQFPKEKELLRTGNKTIEVKTTEKNMGTFMHRLISPEEYIKKINSGEYTHLDIRTSGEYEDEKIAKGLNIDFYAPDFMEQLNKLDKNKKYIFHGRSSNRSSQAVSIFKELGFKEVLELDGGIEAWKEKFDIIK